MNGDGPINLTIDLSTWPRRYDLYEYADKRGIGLRAAIEELVNRGLSHS